MSLLGRRLGSWQKVRGFFLSNEGNYLLDLLKYCRLPEDHVVLEIGSLFGKSTCCLAHGKYRVVSIDPHDGYIQKVLQSKVMMDHIGSTYEEFKRNLSRCHLEHRVEVIRKRSEDVKWDGRPIAMLFIDGIHDMEHVTNDFYKFHEFIKPGGFVAFHDYSSPFYTDVKKFVDDNLFELPLKKEYFPCGGESGSIFALKKLNGRDVNQTTP